MHAELYKFLYAPLVEVTLWYHDISQSNGALVLSEYFSQWSTDGKFWIGRQVYRYRFLQKYFKSTGNLKHGKALRSLEKDLRSLINDLKSFSNDLMHGENGGCQGD